MKTLIWSLTALLAALWTGFIAAVHQLTGWLLSTIDNCIVERPVTDDKGRLAGFRPMKRFPYETFRG